jgi:hypothetical protein
VTHPGKTPDEPGTRRQPDGPQVPAQQPDIENLREPEDTDDLPIPDPYCEFVPPACPGRDRDRPDPRLAARRTAVSRRAPGIHPHPRPHSQEERSSGHPDREAAD